jgi:proline iminopeptidase
MTFTRLVTHYWAHGGWFTEGELMAGAHRLASVPGMLVHGRLALGSPVDSPGCCPSSGLTHGWT